MNEQLQRILAELSLIQKELSWDERVKLYEKITKNYCVHCGSPYLPCFCANDE